MLRAAPILLRGAQRNGGGGPREAWWRGRPLPQLASPDLAETSVEARLPPPPPAAVPLPRCAGEDIARLAVQALLAELATYPKPGLVSLVDSGSHTDMDAATFRRSIAAIAPFFVRLTEAGAALADLRAIGLEAEAAMLAATGGVNTHRGAIFALGLLCAAAGSGARDPAAAVRDCWGETLAGEQPAGSHGARAMTLFGVGGARGEAAAGFPTVVRVGLPALRRARATASPSPACGRRWPDEVGSDEGSIRVSALCHPSGTVPHPTPPYGGATFSRKREKGWRNPSPQGGGEEAARVQTFFALLARVEDTNLLHRGGIAGLAFARRAAAAFLDAGGIAQPDWLDQATAIHRAFVARRLSPGGSADLLAVTLFLDALERRR